LRGVLGSDMIEDEYLFFVARFDRQFVVPLRQIDTVGKVGVCAIGFEANNNFNLFLSVETTVVRGFHRYY
jgi:hypothetical protein